MRNRRNAQRRHELDGAATCCRRVRSCKIKLSIGFAPPVMPGVRHVKVIKMNPDAIREKFGDDYIADDPTFMMGIDQRFTAHMAERFRGRRVLETCTGAGFTTIALARVASQVITVEIDPYHQAPGKEESTKSRPFDLRRICFRQ